MQSDYKNLHMNGYETVEGIAAGVKELVKYDIYFDSGVPKSEATTDNPAAEINLKTASGEEIDDNQGNIFHYIIEQCLWGANKDLVKKLSPEASAKLKGIVVLPQCRCRRRFVDRHRQRKADEFLADCKAWNPTLDECVGALVWMTPTFNTYYDDLKDSLYDPSGKYVSESRVLDMRGIMGSLQLVYNAIRPGARGKGPRARGAVEERVRRHYAPRGRDRSPRQVRPRCRPEVEQGRDRRARRAGQTHERPTRAAARAGGRYPRPQAPAQAFSRLSFSAYLDIPLKRLASMTPLPCCLVPALAGAQVQVVDDVHQLQEKLDSSILDVYENTQTDQTAQDLNRAWQVVAGDITSPEARAMVPADWSNSSDDVLASEIGASRARLQQIAALEMLAHQRAGDVVPTQAWRDLITLPKFANADEGGLLLQQAPDQIKQAGVTPEPREGICRLAGHAHSAAFR